MSGTSLLLAAAMILQGGNGFGDQLVGPNQVNTWAVNGPGSGTVAASGARPPPLGAGSRPDQPAPLSEGP